jgi:hypothetical protein
MECIVCDMCGGPAVFHSTAIDNGKKTESHLCAAHAAEVGLTTELTQVTTTGSPSADEVAVVNAFFEGYPTSVGTPPSRAPTWKAIVDNLRGTANFIRRHGRPPASVEELREGMDLEQGKFPAVEIADAQLKETVERMEQFIGFCQTHKRMPGTPQEWAQFGADIA